jgi:hypothetical protein
VFAFRCRKCDCLHGWVDHPGVLTVRHERREPIVAGSLEPGTTGVNLTWYCPRCGAEHVNGYRQPPARQPDPEAIRLRAYFLWEAANRPAGDGVRFWLTAEEQLRHERSFVMERLT